MELLSWFIVCTCALQISIGQELEPKAGWSDFRERHTLDPNTQINYKEYMRPTWNNWLRNRITDYGTKEVNTVIVATTEQIKAAFVSLGYPVDKTNPTSSDFWSETTMETYTMLLNGEDYDVYDCGTKFYVAASVDMLHRPVHLSGSSTYRDGLPSTNVSSCRRVSETSDSSHSKQALSILSTVFFVVIVKFFISQ